MLTMTFGEVIKVTITNLLKADEYYYSNVGKRTVMSLADAKKMKIFDFEFLLNAQGNFMKAVKDEETGVVTVEEYADGKPVNASAVAEDAVTYDDAVAVVARVNTRANDRYIQFFATQQKICLAPGEVLEFNVKTAAEAAYYLALAVEGEIDVVVGDSAEAEENA